VKFPGPTRPETEVHGSRLAGTAVRTLLPTGGLRQPAGRSATPNSAVSRIVLWIQGSTAEADRKGKLSIAGGRMADAAKDAAKTEEIKKRQQLLFGAFRHNEVLGGRYFVSVVDAERAIGAKFVDM
jgi:hypothetical protein